MPLKKHLADCEAGTRSIINKGAADKLSRWRSYQRVEDLVQFVKELIRKPSGKKNGWEIDQNGGVSLERIVLDLEPTLFDEKDKQIAAKTLGRTLVLKPKYAVKSSTVTT